MDKSREEFVVFLREALADKTSQAYVELYNFLVSCFTRADVKKEGRVYLPEFDGLVEAAAELPRRFNFAPKTSDLYKTDEERQKGRSALFVAVDTEKKGYVTLEKWITYALGHIAGKLGQLPKDCLNGEGATKEDFVAFIKKAVDKKSPEYRELYYFLLRTFQAGDASLNGTVNVTAFDKMIEAAAAAPRRFGLAPKSSELFSSVDDRVTKRREIFQKMNVTNTGSITFDEWLDYSYKHIVGKVAQLK